MTIAGVIDWINTDRIGAIGDGATALAFLLGFAVYMHDRLDKRRAQAEQVTAWLAFDAPPQRWFDDDLWQIHIRNGSDRPVQDLVYMPARGAVDPHGIAFLPPGATETMPCGGDIVEGLEAPYGGGVSLDFTDAAGRRWRRTSSGRLRRWHRWDGQPTNQDVRRLLRASRRTTSVPLAAEGQQDGAETRAGDGD